MDGNGSSIPVFAIENGVVKMVNTRIGMANIDDLFVKGEQIEPGAVTVSKNLPIASTPGGIFDLVVNHGPNINNAHHETRLDFKFTAARGGTGNTFNLGISVTDLASGAFIFSYITNLSAGNTFAKSEFSFYSIPAGRTSTTFRINLSQSTNINYSDVLLGVVVTKNTPNSV